MRISRGGAVPFSDGRKTRLVLKGRTRPRREINLTSWPSSRRVKQGYRAKAGESIRIRKSEFGSEI